MAPPRTEEGADPEKKALLAAEEEAKAASTEDGDKGSGGDGADALAGATAPAADVAAEAGDAAVEADGRAAEAAGDTESPAKSGRPGEADEGSPWCEKLRCRSWGKRRLGLSENPMTCLT